MPRSLKTIALLASGSGSTVATVLGAMADGRLPHLRCGLVIASREDAGVILKAQAAGMLEKDIVIVNPREFASAEMFGDAIVDCCTSRDVELVCQFGWLPHTPKNVIAAYPGRIINQHCGALDPTHASKAHPHPDFGGKGMHGRITIDAALRFARASDRLWRVEATTHHATDKLDGGEVIAYTPMDIYPRDTPDTIQARLLPIEHKLQLLVLDHFGRYGSLPSRYRSAPLIYDDELGLLAAAKAEAIAASHKVHA